jgi:hypothetical protein
MEELRSASAYAKALAVGMEISGGRQLFQQIPRQFLDEPVFWNENICAATCCTNDCIKKQQMKAGANFDIIF